TLGASSGRVAAEDITATHDVPPYERSAMDGYALQVPSEGDASRQDGFEFNCVGKIAAGDWPSHEVAAGACVEIATGAPLPRGTNTVVMVERTSRDGDRVTIHERPTAGQNIGKRGADIASGAVVIRKGAYITPARAGALAALGFREVRVFERPSTAILSTGS